MKKISKKIILAVIPWMVIAAVSASVFVQCCTQTNKSVDTEVFDKGLILNDDLEAVKSDKGFSIKNNKTGKVTIEDIDLEWTIPSPHDSLAVFCSKSRRGYYNVYTGQIAVPAKYRRAWIFSEGLAAVQKNGNIGFINRRGETVIDFKYPYHGNPLSEFVFENGHCVVADTTGKCGVIDQKGKWLILPDYDFVSTFDEYAIATKAGVNLQIDYGGNVINSFVLDDIAELSYIEEFAEKNKDGEYYCVQKKIKTGLFSYKIGGLCGLMDRTHRITEPIYVSICAIDNNLFKARLLDYSSEVIINRDGYVMK